MGTRRTLGSAMLLCSAAAVLLLPLKTPFNSYDEGLVIFNAVRLLGGDVPYRDFWTIYPPGQFYVVAALFKLFGASLLVARLYDTVVRFAIAVLLWRLAGRGTSRGAAGGVLLTASLVLASAEFYAYPVFPALGLGLVSMLGLLRYADRRRWEWLAASGATAGLACLFRWDIGLYAVGSLVAILVLSRRVAAAILFGSAAAVAVMGYGAVAAGCGIEPMWDQLVRFPATTFREVRGLPLPDLWAPVALAMGRDVSGSPGRASALVAWMRFYFPLAVLVGAMAGHAIGLLRSRAPIEGAHLARIGVVVFGVLLFGQALSRYDSIHALPSSLMAILVIFSTPSVAVGERWRRMRTPALAVLFAGLVAIYAVIPSRGLIKAARKYEPLQSHSQVERAGGVYLHPDQERAILFIQDHADECGAIFVGNNRHDKIYTNDVGFYFLAERRSATRYHELHPGVATTQSVQETIAREIEDAWVEWVVLVDASDSREPNASARSSGVEILDRYIAERFCPVAESGGYRLLRATGARGGVSLLRRGGPDVWGECGVQAFYSRPELANIVRGR